MSGLTEILSKKLHNILLCCQDKKVVENKGVTQYMCSSPILFATHLPTSFTLLLRSVSPNWKLISPRSQIFFFGGNLCGFYVLDSSILGEYVTLSVKLYILPAALPSNKKQFARKTLYFEHQAGGVGGGMGGLVGGLEGTSNKYGLSTSSSFIIH